jgi:hypothetical protein
VPGDEQFGTLTQCFAAAAFRGAVVRYSGFLKTADVRGWAGLWMRVDGDNGQTLRFDNMATPVDRSIAGSTDWAQYEIVLDIPPEATTICLGFLLSGTGTVWGDDLEFGVLEPNRDQPAGLPGRQTGQPTHVRSLPAGPSASDVERSVPAGAAESGGEVSAHDELFLGRIVEQEEFEKLLTELSRATKRDERTWSRVVIVHGIGGIGKTTLAARLHNIAGGAAYRDKYEVVCLDWAEVQGS